MKFSRRQSEPCPSATKRDDAIADDEKDRKQLIEIIEWLFPADSEHPETAAMGRKLVTAAKEECSSDWRDEPLEVLEV